MTAAILFSKPCSLSFEYGRLSGSPQMRSDFARCCGGDCVKTVVSDAAEATANAAAHTLTDSCHPFTLHAKTCSVPPTDVTLSRPDP